MEKHPWRMLLLDFHSGHAGYFASTSSQEEWEGGPPGNWAPAPASNVTLNKSNHLCLLLCTVGKDSTYLQCFCAHEVNTENIWHSVW